MSIPSAGCWPKVTTIAGDAGRFDGGVSIGHPDVQPGTLGEFVRRLGPGLEVLSAGQVLADANRAWRTTVEEARQAKQQVSTLSGDVPEVSGIGGHPQRRGLGRPAEPALAAGPGRAIDDRRLRGGVPRRRRA
jgi:hypothetical protein